MTDSATHPAQKTLLPGRPFPLGATVDGKGINFAVFSANAERIELCLFDVSGTTELARIALPAMHHHVWHGYLPGASFGMVYGYRVYGPYLPSAGLRFNPNKLLVDPYARWMIGPRHSHELMCADDRSTDSPPAELPDRRDSQAVCPKAVVIDEHFDWGDEPRPNTPLAESVIYEAHVRGLTMQRFDLDPAIRGTFAALGDARFIDHLKLIGVTALELLPVHPVLHDLFLLEAGLCNYWGYNHLNYFSPDPRYIAGDSPNEVREAIKRLHHAGIEVLIDVVYNHSGEGGPRGPELSFRGFDNASYYVLEPGQPEEYVNDTGCGNTINVAHPKVLQMVMDSLRYWVESFHVDGFRFDLATTLARTPEGFNAQSGFFSAILQDPVLSRVKLIAEPWDVGPGGYQVGNFPAGFSEWNDRFRDCVRRFWRGDAGQRGELAGRLSGSPDFFDRDARGPDASLNFVTAHDGFTMTDLVTYAERHNLANGENNRDGTGNNWSSNWGAADGSDDPAVAAVRERVKRAMLTTLFMSQGALMLLGGDEIGRSQAGNNNAYCHDSPLSWIDWSLADREPGRSLLIFVARLAGLRRELAVVRTPRFLHGEMLTGGMRDTDWFDIDGSIITGTSWNDGSVATFALRRVLRQADGDFSIVLLLFNGSFDVARFVLPEPVLAWRLRLNSDHLEGGEEGDVGPDFAVAPHSVVVLSATLTNGAK
jgi:isoamylase